MSSWSGSSAPPGRWNASPRQTNPAKIPRATLQRVPPQPQQMRVSSIAGTTAINPQRVGSRRTPASVQHGNGVPGADAGNDAAVAAYRLSMRAGNPLSERKLAQMFGRTSRRWARARIADALAGPAWQPFSAPARSPGSERTGRYRLEVPGQHRRSGTPR